MEQTITLTIPANWLSEEKVDQNELRQALKLGLAQLRQQKADLDTVEQVVQALLSTGRVHRLLATLIGNEEAGASRQTPPVLPGPPVSEILIAQRRGEL